MSPVMAFSPSHAAYDFSGLFFLEDAFSGLGA